MSSPKSRLNWEILIPSWVDENGAGILEFEIEALGSYIAHSNCIRRRIREYQRVVRNLCGGLPYKPAQREYRRCHHYLCDAFREGRKVKVKAIENCSPGELNERWRHWIGQRGTLNETN